LVSSTNSVALLVVLGLPLPLDGAAHSGFISSSSLRGTDCGCGLNCRRAMPNICYEHSRPPVAVIAAAPAESRSSKCYPLIVASRMDECRDSARVTGSISVGLGDTAIAPGACLCGGAWRLHRLHEHSRSCEYRPRRRGAKFAIRQFFGPWLTQSKSRVQP
jgi:hypothetical protein